MKKKLLILLSVLSLALLGCSKNSNPEEDIKKDDEQFIAATDIGYSNITNSIGSDILDLNQWYIQYPSGTDEGGMRMSYLDASFNNKYFSRDGEYLKFSLDAQDKGKSPNGSSVRSELHSIGTKYHFSGYDEIDRINHSGNSAEFKYTFKVECTQPDIAEFTVGQFEMYSGYDYLDDKSVPDKPLIMIMFKNGELFAAIKYYTRSYVNGHYEKLQNTSNISLGKVKSMTDISMRIVLNDRSIKIYRDNVLYHDGSFLNNQDTRYGVYFKLGLYYQTKQTDERIKYLFTNVYVKDVFLNIR